MTGIDAKRVDVLIVGAGLSGVGVACWLRRECPDITFTLLERRRDVGGTWDLFRYPGIRSDSDMVTFGYSFRPWLDNRVLADGPSIKSYVSDTADDYKIRERVTFGRKVVSASWSSVEQRWNVTVIDEATGVTELVSARVFVSCAGYYNHDNGYRPTFPGEQRFSGQLVHPQHWPDELDHRGKKVVIIGSGATAVTLVPALAADAGHVTMLQRSPSYIVSLPGHDAVSAALSRVVPAGAVYRLARARYIGLQRASYFLARSQPALMRALVRKGVERQLRGSSDLAHFTPDYDPWDQRLCVVPDGDLFRAVRRGDADVVTDRVVTFTETGLELESGGHLEADIVVTATGLEVQVLGGVAVDVDGEPYRVNEKLTYKGVLLEDLPNAAMIFGYTNASWTLKVDIAAQYLCRVLKHLDKHGHRTFVAHGRPEHHGEGSILGSLRAGYVRRGNDCLPRQGRSGPWRVRNDYLRDAPILTRGRVDDGVLRFDEPAITSREPVLRTQAAAQASG